MVAAWELHKAGYAATIWRLVIAPADAWTIRNGTRVEMTDGTHKPVALRSATTQCRPGTVAVHASDDVSVTA